MVNATEQLAWLQWQMKQGWRVEAPVIERSSAYNARGTGAYEFVLRHEQGCQAICVPDSPELRCFLREQALPVISL